MYPTWGSPGTVRWTQTARHCAIPGHGIIPCHGTIPGPVADLSLSKSNARGGGGGTAGGGDGGEERGDVPVEGGGPGEHARGLFRAGVCAPGGGQGAGGDGAGGAGDAGWQTQQSWRTSARLTPCAAAAASTRA